MSLIAPFSGSLLVNYNLVDKRVNSFYLTDTGGYLLGKLRRLANLSPPLLWAHPLLMLTN